MPDGLELEERGDVIRALPIRFPANDALHVLRAEALELRGVGGGSSHDLKRLARLRSTDELYADLGCGTVLVMTGAAGLVTYVVVWVPLRWF